MPKKGELKPLGERHVRLTVTLPPDVAAWLKEYHAGPSAGITKLVRWQAERLREALSRHEASCDACPACGSPLYNCECKCVPS